jgi:hypothetical protein
MWWLEVAAATVAIQLYLNILFDRLKYLGLYFNIKNYNILNSNIKLYLINKTTAS